MFVKVNRTFNVVAVKIIKIESEIKFEYYELSWYKRYHGESFPGCHCFEYEIRCVYQKQKKTFVTDVGEKARIFLTFANSRLILSPTCSLTR